MPIEMDFDEHLNDADQSSPVLADAPSQAESGNGYDVGSSRNGNANNDGTPAPSLSLEGLFTKVLKTVDTLPIQLQAVEIVLDTDSKKWLQCLSQSLLVWGNEAGVHLGSLGSLEKLGYEDDVKQALEEINSSIIDAWNRSAEDFLQSSGSTPSNEFSIGTTVHVAVSGCLKTLRQHTRYIQMLLAQDQHQGPFESIRRAVPRTWDQIVEDELQSIGRPEDQEAAGPSADI